jgi:hypothetical protein
MGGFHVLSNLGIEKAIKLLEGLSASDCAMNMLARFLQPLSIHLKHGPPFEPCEFASHV